MQAGPCPTERELQAFQLGDLPESLLDAVADHLESCRPCETRAQQLDTALDPVLAAIRNPSAVGAGASVDLPESSSILPPLGSPVAFGGPGPFPFLLPPAQPDEIGRLGPYRVLRLLGKGGMAFVFHAEDITLHRPVALKVMRPDLHRDAQGWQRFLREARIMAAIKHEHLVTVYQAGQEGDVIYLAMELLAGESLGDWMDRQGAAALAEVLRLGREIASGLAVVHRHGLIHRDIKPDNIWLEAPAGNVKILDFGLARFVSDDVRLTQGGMLMGTPSFMSPEQGRGQIADARSDLYSLGVVLYCLCTGQKPFEETNTMALLTALAVDAPRPIQELNPAIPQVLSDLVMQLLAKNPADRPASADAVLERMHQIEASFAGTLRDASPAAPVVLPASVRAQTPRFLAGLLRLKTLLAAVGVGLIAVAAWVVVTRPTGPVPQPTSPEAFGPSYLNGLEVIDPVNFPFRGQVPGPPPAAEPADWPAPLGGRRVSVQGKVAPHGVWMHLPPPDGGTVRVSFRLGGRFRTFATGVSLNDGPPDCIPLTFAVYGDGRLLWKSKPVESQADTQSSGDLSVQGVDKLTLEVSGMGNERGTHAVWIEPTLAQ